MEFIRLKPLYQERVWGGRVLETALGRKLPQDKLIGESWDIVDRPEAQSVVSGGLSGGRTLRELIETRGAEVMGPDWPRERAFPILVKWLDCRERLSLQVHPPKSVAEELKGEPKTENWFIAACEPGSHLIVGLKRGVTRERFERALGELTLETCTHRFPVKAGDSILVRSGQLHAIDGGNLILEIQQNSDTTYRVYDWGRMGLDGKPRAMHVEQSLKSIKWDDFEPEPVRERREAAVIAAADEFRIRREPVEAGGGLSFEPGKARILSVVEGALRSEDGGVVGRGDNVILPFAGRFRFAAEEPSLALVTEDFG
ncbi:MAG: class I mannose-6-phosphate isomerase [Opitutaceae bacterium]|jgi:mannose-6-phosphate isomerase|nr:class I mannose-6-phosphate isomerase [Opitutaceae bacterium]